MPVFMIGDGGWDGCGSLDFEWQVLLQDVGDRVVQRQGGENSPHFCAVMNAILFGTSHTCNFEDHLETTPGPTIHTLTQNAGTRRLKQKNMRWVTVKLLRHTKFSESIWERSRFVAEHEGMQQRDLTYSTLYDSASIGTNIGEHQLMFIWLPYFIENYFMPFFFFKSQHHSSLAIRGSQIFTELDHDHWCIEGQDCCNSETLCLDFCKGGRYDAPEVGKIEGSFFLQGYSLSFLFFLLPFISSSSFILFFFSGCKILPWPRLSTYCLL